MKPDCRSFRRRLEHALEAAHGTVELTSLAWHEHLLGCDDCRALLESEEALEILLASLPEPRLPPQLARRVLARLRAVEELRESALDRLLELDPAANAPGGLAGRVLAGLERERAQPDARLDRLLERARAVEVPAQLSRRVLAHLAEERALARPRRPILARRPLRIAAAVVLLALFGAWVFWPTRAPARRERELAHESVDPRMLEHFEMLQQWELLQRNDLDTLLSTLPPSDQLLLELGSEDGVLGG
jgi:hypothetical protein